MTVLATIIAKFPAAQKVDDEWVSCMRLECMEIHQSFEPLYADVVRQINAANAYFTGRKAKHITVTHSLPAAIGMLIV
jgi:hypothetical protein